MEPRDEARRSTGAMHAGREAKEQAPPPNRIETLVLDSQFASYAQHAGTLARFQFLIFLEAIMDGIGWQVPERTRCACRICQDLRQQAELVRLSGETEVGAPAHSLRGVTK
jgi:hypothetical protein